jgi:putative FmdB family regulatory protein
MPTYEYRCPQGHQFEQFFRSMNSAASEMPCPECGQVAERRVSGGAGFVFKGSGFYITDYGKDGKKDQRSQTSAGESKPASTDAATSKTDSSSSASDTSSSSTTPKKSDTTE